MNQMINAIEFILKLINMSKMMFNFNPIISQMFFKSASKIGKGACWLFYALN